MKKYLKLKYLPNLLGFIRIAIAVTLIPFFLFYWITGRPFMLRTDYVIDVLGVVLISLFMFAGVTDMIDGTIARAIPNAQSEFGATVDGISDMAMVAVCGIFATPLAAAEYGWWLYGLFMGALAYKVIVGVIGHLRHGTKSILIHTYMMKTLGLLLFFIPILFFFTNGARWVMWYSIFMICWLTLTISEELLIHLLLKGSDQDIKSIFFIKKVNARFLAAQAEAAATADEPETNNQTENVPDDTEVE